MKKLNLMLHCGGHLASLEDVANAAAPEGTRTHVPIDHIRVINEVRSNLRQHQYEVVEEAHGLSHEGQRYFGMMQLANQVTDHALVVGLRNSHDKSFPAGISAGSGVFVCDNLAFSGEIKIARKHTRYILRDLPKVTHKAVSKLYEFFRNQENQYDRYKETALTHEGARSLMVEGVKRGVFGATILPKVLKEWEEPSHEEFAEMNVWRFFNAVTEVAKEWSPVIRMTRTQLLHGLCETPMMAA